MTPQAAGRRIKLREEPNARDARYLDAHVDAAGDLHLDGQDLGPATSLISGDGEYEWFMTITARRAGPAPLARRSIGRRYSRRARGELVRGALIRARKAAA